MKSFLLTLLVLIILPVLTTVNAQVPGPGPTRLEMNDICFIWNNDTGNENFVGSACYNMIEEAIGFTESSRDCRKDVVSDADIAETTQFILDRNSNANTFSNPANVNAMNMFQRLRGFLHNRGVRARFCN